jgi:plasmid stabilization system protein ParE
MARGSKSKYTGKQKRKAEHIEEGYEKRGTSKKEAERRAWATVNKESGGGKKSGSGRGKKESKASSRKGGKKGGRKKNAKRVAGVLRLSGHAPNSAGEDRCSYSLCPFSVLGQII